MNKKWIHTAVLMLSFAIICSIMNDFGAFDSFSVGSAIDSENTNSTTNMNNSTIDNVFREICYSEVALSQGDDSVMPSFLTVQNVSKTATKSENASNGVIVREYINGLDDGNSLVIQIDTNKESLKLIYTSILDERDGWNIELVFHYLYEGNSKTMILYVFMVDDTNIGNSGKSKTITGEAMFPYMEKYGISFKDLQSISDRVLYDIFLHDWFEGNGKYSKFSADDIGKVLIYEDTYSKLRVFFDALPEE